MYQYKEHLPSVCLAGYVIDREGEGTWARTLDLSARLEEGVLTLEDGYAWGHYDAYAVPEIVSRGAPRTATR